MELNKLQNKKSSSCIQFMVMCYLKIGLHLKSLDCVGKGNIVGWFSITEYLFLFICYIEKKKVCLYFCIWRLDR